MVFGSREQYNNWTTVVPPIPESLLCDQSQYMSNCMTEAYSVTNMQALNYVQLTTGIMQFMISEVLDDTGHQLITSYKQTITVKKNEFIISMVLLCQCNGDLLFEG